MTRRKRVLVADDREASRAAVARMLKKDFDIVEEGDGAGAIARVKSGLALHAVLLDVEMPNVNGMEAFHRISIIAPDLAKRVLFLTGGAKDPEVDRWLRSMDPKRVLRKPVSAGELRGALQRLDQE